MKRIRVNEDVCVDCHLCEVWCVVEHSKSKDVITAYKEERKGGVLNRVRVEERDKGKVSFALQCRHCDEPDCVYSCITGAMYIDEDGAVRHNPDKCIGCWTCILTCPHGAIQRNEAAGNIASKCDLCPDREVPACVEHCPNEALSYEECDDESCDISDNKKEAHA